MFLENFWSFFSIFQGSPLRPLQKTQKSPNRSGSSKTTSSYLEKSKFSTLMPGFRPWDIACTRAKIDIFGLQLVIFWESSEMHLARKSAGTSLKFPQFEACKCKFFIFSSPKTAILKIKSSIFCTK